MVEDLNTNILNLEKIQESMEELNEQFDLEARLSRYNSMTPELVEFAESLGLEGDDATRALFISDFVITSSEVPAEYSDKQRREAIINTFKLGLKKENVNSEAIMYVFYLANKVYIRMKRIDSFLAGRGVNSKSRKIILFELYAIPYLEYCHKELLEGPANFELGILESVLTQQLPETVVENVLNMETNHYTASHIILHTWNVIENFVMSHNAELNEDSPLPNIATTGCFYLDNHSAEDKLILSKSGIDTTFSKEVLDASKSLQSFLNDSDTSNKLIYLRGKILNSDDNLLLTRNPYIDEKPLLLLKTPINDINVTEMMDLLYLRNLYDTSFLDTSLSGNVSRKYTETVTKQVEDTVHEEVEEEVMVEITPDKEKEGKDNQETSETSETSEKEQKEEREPKKVGLFGKIKRFFLGSPDKEETEAKDTSQDTPKSEEEETEPKYEKRIQKKTVEKKVVRNIEEEVEKEEVLAYQIDDDFCFTLGLYAVEDLRLFEEFDTIREAEYEIIGAIMSNFEQDKTDVMTTEKLSNPKQIFQLLDGIDNVIEELSDLIFKGSHQIIPTELIFLADDNKRFIITMDGDESSIVGTIAKTFEKDITDWQNQEQIEKVQRRTLHMRTGQLLSSMKHTPFDRATERIFGGALSKTIKLEKYEEAILKLQ